MRMGHGLARVLYAARSVASALGRLHRSESPLAISLTKVMQEPVVRPHDLRNREPRRPYRRHAAYPLAPAPSPLRAGPLKSRLS